MVGLKKIKLDKPSEPLIYKKKPLFGFDIGHGSVKIIELKKDKNKVSVNGYGSIQFDPVAIQDGEIVDFEIVAKAIKELFNSKLIGNIETSSAAVSLPVTHTFSRVVTLPILGKSDLIEAIKLEAEQYIPIPVDDLYIDYQIIEQTNTDQDILLAAAPKRVVDSYINLFNILGLEVAILEPSILSVTRLVKHAENADVPTLVIDLGSMTTDLIIVDGSVRVTGTIKFGGNNITSAIATTLNIDEKEAHILKTKYGLDPSKKQAEITDALNPVISKLVSEIRKVVRYFEDRSEDRKSSSKVEQIIILGGGANLPGFSSHLTGVLRIPTRLCSSWQNIGFDKLQPPHQAETTMYATATGLGLINEVEVLK